MNYFLRNRSAELQFRTHLKRRLESGTGVPRYITTIIESGFVGFSRSSRAEAVKLLPPSHRTVRETLASYGSYELLYYGR